MLTEVLPVEPWGWEKGVPLNNRVKGLGRKQGGTDISKIQMVVEIK